MCRAAGRGRWRAIRRYGISLRVEELARQADRQRAILTGALGRLAAGGRLVYSTCSLEPEENEQVVKQW